MPLISIVIRTKNEERWMAACLEAVSNQDFKDFEVILVDNESTDKTVNKAQQFKVAKVIACRQFLPGAALNAGIRASSGRYIVCLSGHCIPVNSKWLSNMLRNFDDKEVAGVYGRQQPLSFTPDADKRDLAIVFGLDRKEQRKDSFFHNANSMIRRDIWRAIPFDETVTNIEDRIWAKNVLAKGHKIVYEPEASVYHYHGIHHDGNPERCSKVVRILESLDGEISGGTHVDIKKLNVIAIVPIRGKLEYLKKRPLIAYTIERALQSKYIKKLFVSTDSREIADLAIRLGAQAPFLRDKMLSVDYVTVEDVLQFSLAKIEESGVLPDVLVALEVTFPFRPVDLIDSMISDLIAIGLDSVVTGRKENKSIWGEEGDLLKPFDEAEDVPRKYKKHCFVALRGLCCITRPQFLRTGSLLGPRVGIFEVDSPYASVEVRDPEGFKMAELLIDEFWKRQTKTSKDKSNAKERSSLAVINL